jgi:mono/diheme cytochrome c family protein
VLKSKWTLAGVGLAAVMAVGPAAVAQETAEATVGDLSGPALFKSYCGSCHGATAQGDGPLADVLRFRPADLTQIAKRAQGRFDKEKVHRMIDGRNPVKGHGGPDMPLWGDAFKRSGGGYSEQGVRDRIDTLVEYLEGLQVK